MKTILENPLLRYLAITFLSISLLMVTGCSGCSDKDDAKTAKQKEEEKKKKKKTKKKQDFDTLRSVVLPGYFPKIKTEKEKEEERNDPAAAAMNRLNRPESRNRTKLGHWVTTNFQVIANNFNSDGQLTTYSQTASSKPVRIPATDYFISTSRPVSLPKEEWKNFETTVFLPTRLERVRAANINYQIGRSSGGLAQVQVIDFTPLMLPHQFHFVLLSNRPDNYKYLEGADSIRLRGGTMSGAKIPEFYFIVPSVPGDPLPLPRSALNWTTIAYLVWDDYDPTLLDLEHQQAMLDWIHYGGQLIVSGPDSLDKLQNSFLADYLPAHFDKSRNLTNADVEELNKNWTVKLQKNPAAKRTLQISEQVPLLGVDFKPHTDAEYVDGTGEIAIERKLGRGRIVITAFSLSAPPIRNWRSFKSFLNGALLRKPARNFGKVRGDDETVAFEWAKDGANLFDPLLGSTLRFLSRDLSTDGTSRVAASDSIITVEESINQAGLIRNGYNGIEEDASTVLRIQNSKNQQSGRNLDNDWHYGGYQDAEQSGVAGWNDQSGISIAARDTLKEAAGIKPPSSMFVLKMLGAYLFVLVPLNWFVFRMIGKVEYAWIAAPVIAIAGAFLVIKFAALDIGFVRSNTQVGILEIQADYPRAHLAEYSALYTSLSTRYSADLDNLTAQSLPFGIEDNPKTFVPGESMSQVQMRRTMKNRLEGFQIQSNTTGLVHTEYLLDLQGVFSFPASDTDPMVTNSTNVNVANAGVVGRDSKGNYQFAWIGDLAAGDATNLEFEKREFAQLNTAWTTIPAFQSTDRVATLIWKKNLKSDDPDAESVKSATFEVIKEFPELQSKWPEYERLLRKNATDSGLYPQAKFEEIYQALNSNSEVSIGRMFDKVIKNLTIAKGEYRLIGSTNERLGKTTFDPASTQIDQQTLIVVHLKPAPLPEAKPDWNSLEEFTSRSSLDYENETIRREKEAAEADEDEN